MTLNVSKTIQILPGIPANHREPQKDFESAGAATVGHATVEHDVAGLRQSKLCQIIEYIYKLEIRNDIHLENERNVRWWWGHRQSN